MSIYLKLVIDALRSVRYPGHETDIVADGMVVDNLRIGDRRVELSLLFSRNPDPFSASLLKSAEMAVRGAVGGDVEVVVTAEYARKAQPKEETALLAGVENIIAVSSGKGGVGKSTVAVNLAVALARLGRRVALLDADIFGPSLPRMLNVEDYQPYGEQVGDRVLIEPALSYGVKMLSIGFFVRPEQATVWRGPMASNALKQLITEADWGEVDDFIIDTPPGTSDIHLTLMQELRLTGAVVVTTPQQVALADARKGVDMYRNEKIGVPLLGLVENMAWFTPAELSGSRYYIFGRGGGEQLAGETGVPLLGQIPLVQSICESGDVGAPVAAQEASAAGRAFCQLAERVLERCRELRA